MTADPMQRLMAHAEAHAAVSRIAARYDFDRNQLDPEVVDECDRYGVELHTHCNHCHGEDGAHEQFCPEGLCRICERPGCAGDCADAAHDRWAER